jgi:FKBP-type peptidyl-prolyl cis-trans isomerase
MNKFLSLAAVALLAASFTVTCSEKKPAATEKPAAAKPAAVKATVATDTAKPAVAKATVAADTAKKTVTPAAVKASDTVTTPSGLKYVVEKKGTGAKPAKGTRV